MNCKPEERGVPFDSGGGGVRVGVSDFEKKIQKACLYGKQSLPKNKFTNVQ